MLQRLFTIALLVLACCGSAWGQVRGSLQVSAQVQPSMLLVVTSPAGSELSQGGTTEASLSLTLMPASPVQGFAFANRVLEANQPGSPGYRLFARLTAPINGKAVLDGVELRENQDVLLASPLSYRESRSHMLDVSFGSGAPSSVSVLLTVKPN